MNAFIEVEVGIRGEIARRLRAAARREMRDGIADVVRRVISELGIPATPHVGLHEDVAPTNFAHPLSLRVDERLGLLTPDLVSAAVRLRLPHLPYAPWAVDRQLADIPDQMLTTVVVDACERAVCAWPAVLLGDASAAALHSALQAVRGQLPAPAVITRVARALLHLHMSLADISSLARLLAEHRDASERVLVERLVGASRSKTLRVQLHPALFREITVVSGEQTQALIPFLRAGMFEECGVLLPDIRFDADAALDRARLRFRVNDLTGPPELMLPQGDLLVSATPDKLELLGISSRPAVNPATGDPAALVGAANRILLETEGLTAWDEYEFVILSLAALVREQAGCLIAIDVIDDLLERSSRVFPVLVAAVREAYPLEELTWLFRELITGGVSLRDMPPLLERLVDIAVDALPFGDALLPRLREAAAPRSTKTAMRGHNIVVAYLLPQLFEQHLAESYANWDPQLPPDEVLAAELLDAYLGERAKLPSAEPLVPVLLTSEAARPAVAKVLRGVWPVPRVISYVDLVPSTAVLPFARLDLTGTSR